MAGRLGSKDLERVHAGGAGASFAVLLGNLAGGNGDDSSEDIRRSEQHSKEAALEYKSEALPPGHICFMRITLPHTQVTNPFQHST
jgi:predicted N-acetyltransferase YhbS